MNEQQANDTAIGTIIVIRGELSLNSPDADAQAILSLDWAVYRLIEHSWHEYAWELTNTAVSMLDLWYSNQQ